MQFRSKRGFRAIAIVRGKDKEPLARQLVAHHYIDSQAGDAAAAFERMMSNKARFRVVITTGNE